MQSIKQTTKVWFIQRMTVLWFAVVTVLVGSGIPCLISTAKADVTAGWNQDADDNWSTGTNWQGGNAPTGTTGVAYFTNAITASRMVSVDFSPWTVGGLTFGNTGAYGFTVSGGTVNLGGTTPTITVNPNSTGIVSSVLSGTAGLTKVGAGTLTLDGANTFSGGTTISAGTLNITSSGALNGTTSVNPVSGGTLTISGTVNITNGVFAAGCGTTGTGTMNIESGAVVNVANGAQASRAYLGGKLDNTGSAGLGVLNLNGGTLTISAGGSGAAGDATCFWLNPYANGGATTLNLNGGVLTTARQIGDGGSGTSILNFNGGTLQLAASISLIVNPTIGANNVRNGGAIIDTQGYTVTQAHAMIHSPIGGDNAIDGGLTKLGSGVLTLTAANTYTGPTTVSNGLLVVPTTSALPGYATAGKVTVGNGAGLSIGVGSWSSAAITALINAGAYTNGSIFGFDTTAGNYTFSGQFTFPVVAGLVKTGPNALTFPGGTGFAGSVNVLGGILQADFGAGIPATTNVVLNNGSLSSSSATITASLGTGAGQITLTPNTSVGFSAVNTPLTVNLGGAGAPLSWGSSTFNPSVFVLNDTGANTNLAFAHALALNNATRTINVNAAVAEISGVISNGSVTAGLVKGGAGTMKLSAANTYSGGTTISAGTLALTGGNNRLNTAGAIALNAGTLDLGGNTQAMTTGNFTMANATTLQNGTINYKNADWYPNASASVTFGAGGGFNSLGRLLLNDSQTLTLASGAGASSFAGDGAGACNFIGVDRINANTVVVNGGSLNFTNMASGAGYLRIGMTGSSVVKSTGTLTVNNGAVNIGHSMSMGTKYDMSLAQALGVATLNINGGEVAVGTGSSTAPSYGNYGALCLGNGHPSTVSKSTINLNGGTLSLIQLEGGNYGTNTVNFNGGTLKARTNSTAFVTGSKLVCNVSADNARIDTAGFTVGMDANLSGLGSLVKQGAGILVLNGSNTFNGTTSVEAGTLMLSPFGDANLKLHLDASDASTLFTNATGVGAVTTSGQPVGYWGDLSGNNKPALQTVLGQRPTYTNSVAEFNGKAALLFDGSDDDLTSLLNINATNLPNMTVIMVFRQVSIKLSGGLWGHDNGAWDRLQLLNFGSVGANNIATDNNSAQVKGMNTNAVLIYSAVLKNGVPNGSYVYINGVSDSNTGLPGFTSKETDNGAPSLTIGKIGPGATYYPGHILIGEVLVYDTTLGDVARRNVEARLRNKWLGTSDPITPVLNTSGAVQLTAETLAGLKLRLDASVASSLFTNSTGVGAVTTVGQPVGYWGDLSGNNKPALQATLGSRPTYTNSPGAFNNLPVLHFDGVNQDIISALNINAAAIPNMTIMMVCRQVTYKLNGALWGHDDGGWDRIQLLNFGSTGANNIAENGKSVLVKGMHTNAVLMYTAVLKNGVSNGSYVYINGVSDANTGLPAFTSNEGIGLSTLTIGAIAPGSYRGNIQIGEVLVFDTVLSDTARRNVEDYFHNKWFGGAPEGVNIANGAILDLDGASQTLASVSGAGTVSNGTLTVTQPLSPAGDSIGTLKAANMAFNATLRINVDLNGSCDQLVGSGNLNLTGLTLQIADTNLLNKAKRYTIVNCSGTLTGELTATLPTNWRLYYDRTAGAATATLVYIPPGTMIRFM